jgi:Mn-dependent DtxR family transcriptional regulator
MLVLSVIFGGLAALLGYMLALIWDSSIAGAISVAAGILFLFSMIFSSRYGLLGRVLHRFNIGVQFASDHLLLSLYRAWEKEKRETVKLADLLQTLSTSRLQAALAVRINKKRGVVFQIDHRLGLTSQGQDVARSLIQGHRLWEHFADRELGLPADHVHESANRVEHFIDESLQKELQKRVDG